MNLSKIVALAEQIATEAHKGQFRRGGIIPYIEHPRTVVSRVGEDEDAQVVAWLHDVLEDCEVTEDELIEKGIPEKHVSVIRLLTKTKGVSYELYLERVASSDLASKVKIADMISNLADHPTPRQIKKYAKGLERLSRDF